MSEVLTHKELERFNAIVPESVIKLSGESYWVGLRTKSGSVEGKLYLPQQPNGSVLLFEPGFPGDASTRLDRLWAKDLVSDGYAIFAARHSGTVINGEYSNTYLNSPEKQEQARAKGQEILGEKANPTVEDWLKEPLVMMEAFVSSHQEVVLAGHSFGGLATFFSLIDFAKENPELAGRIKRVVSLAGTVGRHRTDGEYPMKGWDVYMDTETVRKKIRIGDLQINLNALRNAYIKIHDEASSLPKDTDFLLVVPWGNKEGTTDELVPPVEALDMLVTLGRGYLIFDQEEMTDENSGRLAHDMDNLKSETLVQLLNKDWHPQTQISTI